ncbi:MAG: D-alanyl-D-alanine carboxypeptidase (penicillin-binding protein 5/6) [Verrucomicrobiales bacterium]|jgi:D-alanyl-D-alanine carboxypeptidase (penicillin-binding protein 5/6)
MIHPPRIRFLFLGFLSLLISVTHAVEPANAYIVVDHYTGKIFAQKNADQKLPVASLTKVAAGCLVVDWAQATSTNLSQVMAVPPHAPTIGGANPLGLQSGDQLTLRDGLYSALMASDNVTAESLAYHVGNDLLRRRGKGGDPIKEFVREMNALAGKLGMRQTKFANAHGLDHGLRRPPYSTAKDLCRLTKYAMDKGDFRFYVSQKSRKISVSRQGQKRSFGLKNTNQLVGTSRVDGVKTGQTTASGPCLIVSAIRPNRVSKRADGASQVQKLRLNAVVLGAQDRFRSGKQLIDWGWREFDGWNSAGRPMSDRNGSL